MTDEDNNNKIAPNNKKNYLIFGFLLAIIAVLLAGVIYQFVCIKKMQRQLNEQNSNAIILVESNNIEDYLHY